MSSGTASCATDLYGPVPLPADAAAQAEALSAPDGRRDGLEALCALARELFGARAAVVTLAGDPPRTLAANGRWLPALAHGAALCAATAASDEVLVLAEGADDLRFYAGAPLTVAPGARIGALCVLDTEPRAFSAEDAGRLRLIAGLVVAELKTRRELADLARREAELERLALHDTVTGLPSRAFFQQKVQAAVELAAQRSGKVGLIFLDLDHFKDVNDSLGHEAGDALLRSVAERLSAAYRSTDLVARFGGDEFAVLLPGVKGPDDLTRPTEKALELLRHPLEHGGKSLSITASVGCALYPEGDDDAAQLVKNAEIALFRAKAEGRNGIVAFAPEMRWAVERRIELLAEVRAGLERSEFALHYQPVVEIGTGRIAGFEALTRWAHPTRGLLAPAAFMDAFDDQDLALRFGEERLEAALRQMRAWLDQGVEFGGVALNCSAAEFRTGRLAERVLQRLAAWDVPPERLCIEVTENVYMGWGAEVVGDAARALHAAGVLIALDDFGTGYASLTHLKSFPIDRLKIDRSFMRSEADAAIVSAVITLGAGLGMKVIAEGVEDEAQLRFLARAGCDQAQGHLLGRPMPAKDVPAWLQTRTRA